MRRVPIDLESVRGRARLLLALGDDAHDVAVVHDRDDAGHGTRGAIVDACRASATSRWTGDGAARKAVEPDIGRVARAPGDDVTRLDPREWRADVPPALRRQERLVLRDGACEWRVAHEVGVADPSAVAVADRAALRVESCRGDAELRGCPSDQAAPRERRGEAQRGRFLCDRVAPEGPEVEWHLCGVAEDDAHALHRDVELVRDELRERGADALAELDLAGERGHRPVGLDPDALLHIHLCIAGEEPAATALVPAARCTARIARPYTPQRQRLPASASRIAASSGAVSRARSAAAAMIIPLVQ